MTALTLAAASTAHAADRWWTGYGSADWAGSPNWSNSTQVGVLSAPGPADTAVFGSSTGGANLSTTLGNTNYSVLGLRTDTAQGVTTNFSISSSVGTLTVGSGGITHNLPATLTISAPLVNSGPTTINAGTLQIGSGGTTGSISGDITNNANLAFNRSTDFAYAGVISGPGNLIKSGSGVLQIGNTNTYSGTTTINAGVLDLRFEQAISPASPVTIHSAGVLRLSSSYIWGDFRSQTTPAIEVKAGGILESNNSFNALKDLKLSGGELAIRGTGSTLALGAFALKGVVTVSGTQQSQINSYSPFYDAHIMLGYPTIYTFDGGETIFDIARVTTTATPDLIVNTVLGNTLSNTGTSNQPSRLIKTGAGIMTLTQNNTYTGATTISGGTINIGDGGSAGFIQGTIVNNAALTINRANDLTYASGISGSGTLTKLGAGKLTITGNLTHNGLTTITAGILDFYGVFFSIKGDIANNAALIFNRLSTSYTYAGAISGSGSVTKLGSGTLTLTGANTYTGATIVSGGTLALAQAGNLGATPVTLLAGSTLNLSGRTATDFALAAGLAGSGTLEASGKTVTVSTAFTPGTLVVNGNLALAANTATTLVAAATPAASSIVNVTGTLVLKGSLAINEAAGFDFAPDQTFAFATATGGITPGLLGVTVHGVALAESSPDVWSAHIAGLAYTFSESTATLAVSTGSTSPLQAWRDLYFPSAGNDGTGIGADSADPDGDGLANLIEYATHTSPLAANGSPVVVGRQGDHLSLTFPRIDDPALRYTVEGRDDLASGTWTTLAPVAANNPTFGFAGAIADETETVSETVIDPVSLPSRPRRFLRLSIDFVP